MAKLPNADPEHWRARAEEARTRASEFEEPVARRMMEGIAETYDKLAEWAERYGANDQKIEAVKGLGARRASPRS